MIFPSVDLPGRDIAGFTDWLRKLHVTCKTHYMCCKTIMESAGFFILFVLSFSFGLPFKMQ